MCVCNDVGMFKLFWKIQVAEGVFADYMFIVPCANCSLSGYSSWLVKYHSKLCEIHPNLVAQETVIGSQ